MSNYNPDECDTTGWNDNQPLTHEEILHMIAVGDAEDRRLKQELAKTNYLNIHKKRKKR